MRKLYFLFIAVLFSGYSYGQQDPLYAQYLTNPMIFNPAYAGLNNAFNGAVSYRNQWAGFNGAPSTTNFSAHSSFVDNKVGIGAMFIADKAGFLKNNELEFLGSYKLNFDKYTVSFGMNFGFLNSTYQYDRVTLPNPQDPAFPSGGNMKYSWPNIGVGAILRGEQFIVGLSVPRLTQAKAGDTNFLIQSQHIYLYGAYVYYLGTRLRLKPSVLLRGTKGSPIAADLNFNINIDTKYTAGVFLRNFKSYGVLVQAWVFDKFRFGYAFELPTGSSVGPQFTSHELTLAVKMAVLNSHDRSYSEF
jgi:type IX secretion system PorP/SprF family membrane protein